MDQRPPRPALLRWLDLPAYGLRRFFSLDTWARFGRAMPETKGLIDRNAWPLLGVLLVAAMVLLVWWGPKWYAAGVAQQLGFATPADQLKAEQDARGTLLQAIGGLVVLITLYRGWREFHQGQRERNEDLRQRTEELALTRQNSVADRFSRAIGQLGSESADVRLGAIFSLDMVARENPTYHWPVMDVFAAYVQDHTRDNYALAEQLALSGAAREEYPQVANDVYYVLNALAKRNVELDATAEAYIDLSHSCLCHAAIGLGADFNYADFSGAHLEYALLRGVQLNEARFDGAWLKGCDFTQAQLEGASFRGARLDGANFSRALGLKWEQLSAAASLDAVTLPDCLEAEQPQYV